MSNSKRNKGEMAPSFHKSRKVQDSKSDMLKSGDKTQPTPEQIRLAQMIDPTKPDDPQIKEKVKQLMDATQKSEEDCIMALHDCDLNMEAAAEQLIEGNQDTWSTSTKKKKNKPAADKLKDSSNSNADGKGSNTAAGDADDWNESDNADDNSAQKSFGKGKGPINRTNSRPQSRPWNKRGGGGSRPNSKLDSNHDWSKGAKYFQGRNTYKTGRNSNQKENDGDHDISDRLGQSDVLQEKHDSASDYESEHSEHGKNANADDPKQNDSHQKSQSDNKWHSEDSYSRNARGRGGSRNRGGYSSYGAKQNDDSDTRSFYGKGSMSRGRGGGNRYPRSDRGRGGPRAQRDNRGGDYSWEDPGDRGGYRGGGMANGPSRSWGRGAPRGRGRGPPRQPIDTWNPLPKEDSEDWDQEEDYTGSLADTKVFTPSANVESTKVPSDPVKEIIHEPEVSSQLNASQPAEVTSNSLSTSASQFLSQLTSASSKPLPTSVFNDVHFNKTDLPTTDFSAGFNVNSYADTESPSMPLDDISRVKNLRPRLPPPSKIPSSAVEMPPDVGTGMSLVDVQFGALELGDMISETVQNSTTQESPSPTPEPPVPPETAPIIQSSEPSPLLNDTQSYTSVRSSVPSNAISQLPELLSSKSESSTSNYYQDSIYHSSQFPKSTHQSYNSTYTTQVGSTYNTQSIYGSAGLGTTSLSNPYHQTYSGSNLPRPSALTSTTNSKEFDVPTPSVNISPMNQSSGGTTVSASSILSSTQGNIASKSNSTMGKVMTVPPGVAGPPIVNPPYIMNQTAGVPYFQQPLFSIDEYQLLQQQRLPPSHVSGYYDMAFQNTTTPREGVQYSLNDTRFAQGDTNTSPVQATSLSAQTAGSQNQPLMNPALAPPFAYAYYGGPSMIPGNYQFSTPLYPIAQAGTGSGHANNSSPYAKTATNYTGSYTGAYENSQGGSSASASDYKTNAGQVGVSKVQGYQPANTSTSTGLSNIYSKSYEKQNFCQTPPPYPHGSGSSALGASYGQAQQLFYSPVTPHHAMPLHQDTSQGQRSQLAPQQQAKLSSKANTVRQYPPPAPAPFWHPPN